MTETKCEIKLASTINITKHQRDFYDLAMTKFQAMSAPLDPFLEAEKFSPDECLFLYALLVGRPLLGVHDQSYFITIATGPSKTAKLDIVSHACVSQSMAQGKPVASSAFNFHPDLHYAMNQQRSRCIVIDESLPHRSRVDELCRIVGERKLLNGNFAAPAQVPILHYTSRHHSLPAEFLRPELRPHVVHIRLQHQTVFSVDPAQYTDEEWEQVAAKGALAYWALLVLAGESGKIAIPERCRAFKS